MNNELQINDWVNLRIEEKRGKRIVTLLTADSIMFFRNGKLGVSIWNIVSTERMTFENQIPKLSLKRLENISTMLLGSNFFQESGWITDLRQPEIRDERLD